MGQGIDEEVYPWIREQALSDPASWEVGRVHDWRNHIGDRVLALWGTFTDEQKIALAADADDRAGMEHWE